MYIPDAPNPETWAERPASRRTPRHPDTPNRRQLGKFPMQGPFADRALRAPNNRRCPSLIRPASPSAAAKRLHDLEADSVEPEVRGVPIPTTVRSPGPHGPGPRFPRRPHWERRHPRHGPL